MTTSIGDETTPLIRPSSGTGGKAEASRLGSLVRRALSVENRILFAGFLITLSFSFTQVP